MRRAEQITHRNEGQAFRDGGHKICKDEPAKRHARRASRDQHGKPRCMRQFSDEQHSHAVLAKRPDQGGKPTARQAKPVTPLGRQLVQPVAAKRVVQSIANQIGQNDANDNIRQPQQRLACQIGGDDRDNRALDHGKRCQDRDTII